MIESQGQNKEISSIRDMVQVTKVGPFTWMVVFGYRGKVVVPQSADLRKVILREFHCSRFAMHPSGMEMYHDLHRQYY